METKKEPGKDLARHAGLFRSIGFLIALSLVVMAFEWRSPDMRRFDIREEDPGQFIPEIDTPPTPMVPPRPVPRTIVPTDTKEVSEPAAEPELDWEYTGEIGTLAPPVEGTDEAHEGDFILVEEPASPHGGYAAFYSFIHDQLRGNYPAAARRIGIEGRVFLEFIVEKDGALSSIRLVKGIGGGCDELAMRALASSPPWKPGKQRGKPVRQRMTLPIFFKLG